MKTNDEHPILMQPDMVRATLADRKTQTRRLAGLDDVNSYPGLLEGDGSLSKKLGYQGLCKSAHYIKYKTRFKENPGFYHWFVGEQPDKREINPIIVRCPYGKVGDRLWVKETWSIHRLDSAVPGEKEYPNILYKADSSTRLVINDNVWQYCRDKFGWRPSIFMPRWASRINLEIVDIRVERLQDISRADAIAEGIEQDDEDGSWLGPLDGHPDFPYAHPHEAYAGLWDSINGEKKGCAWIDNPFVWCIVFKRLVNNG